MKAFLAFSFEDSSKSKVPNSLVKVK